MSVVATISRITVLQPTAESAYLILLKYILLYPEAFEKTKEDHGVPRFIALFTSPWSLFSSILPCFLPLPFLLHFVLYHSQVFYSKA